MKKLIAFFLLLAEFSIALTQDARINKFILIPHPRSNDQVNQSVQQGIEKIDLSDYDMTLLGGDLTYNTTIDYATMDYCDTLFDLGNSTTLWSIGNHDLNHPDYISEYTHRPDYYACYVPNITFLVLNTERDANGFVSSYISGEQLALIQELADTIEKSNYLVLLQHRLLWMIGNDDLESKLDSVGASTRELDTSNFYPEVYPLLQQVKSKGIQIICLGGDRADINIEYSPEDSITYLASTMVPDFPDTVNQVIIFTCHPSNDSISWEFVPLADIEENEHPSVLKPFVKIENPIISYDINTHDVIVHSDANSDLNTEITVYDIAGRCISSERISPDDYPYRIPLLNKGIFIVTVKTGSSVFSKKIVSP